MKSQTVVTADKDYRRQGLQETVSTEDSDHREGRQLGRQTARQKESNMRTQQKEEEQKEVAPHTSPKDNVATIECCSDLWPCTPATLRSVKSSERQLTFAGLLHCHLKSISIGKVRISTG